jgi:membrane protease YdiL (CAAX protease family)
MQTITLLLSLSLTAYLILETWRSPRLYRQLQVDLTLRIPGARLHFYAQTLRFELITGALALLVMAIHRVPLAVGLEHLPMLERFSIVKNTSPGFWVGFGSAFLIGTLIATRLKPAPEKRVKWLPDFDAMLPETAQERLWFAAVALSAGVCEELVFRGWLLQTLNGLGLEGAPLLLLAAALFGLAHAYQGPLGVVSTAYLALMFTSLMVATGSLLLPMVVHTLIDLRWVVSRRTGAPPPLVRADS